jgi:hypothetical protein
MRLVVGCVIFQTAPMAFSRRQNAVPIRTDNSALTNWRFLMKTTMKTHQRATVTVLSLLCAGLCALSIGGCAEGYYAGSYYTPNYGYTDYYTPEYRYRTYYAPDYYPYYPYYSYYGGAYY